MYEKLRLSKRLLERYEGFSGFSKILRCLGNYISHLLLISSICRSSSHQRCSVKKGVLRNFAKFTGKHLC